MEDKNDEIMNKNSVNNENNLPQLNEIISSINNNDLINNMHIVNKIELETVDEAVNAENQHTVEKKDGASIKQSNNDNNSSNNNNNNNNNEEGQDCNITLNKINMEAAVANQADLSKDEQSGNNNAPNKAIQTTSGQEGGDANGLIFILRVQKCREVQVARRDVSRSRSPNNRIRPTTRRRRRRRRGAVAQESPPEEGPSQEPNEEEGEADDLACEWITRETVPCNMTRTWRIVPKYKRLTVAEVAKQEADLFYSFLKETKPEKVEPVGPDDRQCCVCFENKATRIVAPCGHLCLCYNCAKAIAFNRTVLASTRIQKKCPLCRAAISKIMRLL